MAVFSSDQVNHVFVNKKDVSTVTITPATPEVGKAASFSAATADGKFLGGITIDTLTYVGKEKTVDDILKPMATVADLDSDPTGDQYVEVCVTISGALCDDEGNQLTFCGNGADVNKACADLKKQAEARNAKTLIGQLLSVELSDDGNKIFVKTPDQDYTLGNWVVPTLQVFTKLIDPTKAIGKVVEVKAATYGVSDSQKLVTAGQQAQALEYFALGERADVYRNVGWPKAKPSKQILDGTETDVKATTYEGFYAGDCEDVQKSKIMVTVITAS